MLQQSLVSHIKAQSKAEGVKKEKSINRMNLGAAMAKWEG